MDMTAIEMSADEAGFVADELGQRADVYYQPAHPASDGCAAAVSALVVPEAAARACLYARNGRR